MDGAERTMSMGIADRNLIDAWRTLGMRSAAGMVQIEEDDDVLLMSSDTPLAFFNPVFLKRHDLDAAAVFARIRRFYGTVHEPFMIWVLDGHHADLVELAVGEGMRVTDGPPPMALDPIGDAPEPPEGLEVVEVRTTELLDATVDVIAAGYGLPIDLAHQILGPSLLEDPNVAIFTGQAHGYPVSSATLIVTEGPDGPVAGVYNVATPQPNRGRGFGEALTWAAVEEGRRRGCTIAVLQASGMGYPIYERMGFRTVGGYRHLVGGP